VTQAGGPQPGGFNRGSQIPNNVPNGPIVIGPATANSNSPNNINSYNNINALPASRPAPTSPSGERTGMADGFPAAPQSADDPLFNVNGNINAKNTLSGSQNWNVPNPAQQVLPQGFPNQNVVSPLDAMPNWPPANSTPSSVPTNTLPSINPNPSLTRNNFQPFVPPNGAWPQGSSSNTNTADDAARAASRMGMNAGPGNPFPITPGPSANAPNSFGPNSSAPSSFGPNSLGPNNGGNFNQRPLGPAPGEPPSGSFGPGGYDTSAKPPTMPESPAQFALRDRLPPSEQYQTPASFNAFGSNNSIAPRPSNFAPSRGIPNPNVNPQAQSTRDLIAEMERASARSTPDRAGGDDRWEQGSAPNGLNTTVPTMQGFLATQSGDNSLAEYERMNQLHNAERNLIQQQLDSQRQLPGSENYFRSSTQSQLGSSTNTDTRLGPTSFSRRSNFNPMSSNNAPRQMP
jgi:hypothetical protein